MSTSSQALSLAQRIDFMRRIHLFYRLDDLQYNSVAAKIQERVFKPGEVILRQGGEGDRFYMIYSGSVSVKRRKPHGEEVLAKLVPGDYFGEEALIYHTRRNATVTALEKTVLLTLSRSDFNTLLRNVSQLKSNFAVAVNSHKLARQMRFKWLREDQGEVIYFLARKHPILLARALAAPVILFLLVFIGLMAGFAAGSPAIIWACAIALGLIIGWGAWNGVDWGNDYYIVTNQRVVYLEKVVGLYDSRQEAPLSAVQRINVQTEYWGRQLDYGTLIIRTIVGSTLTLKNVNHPAQAAALVEEHWRRAKQNTRKEEEAAMRKALRERMARPAETVQAPPLPPPIISAPPPAKKKSPFPPRAGLFANFFRVRFETSAVINYRKHWVVLVIKSWLPALLMIGMIAWLVYEIIHVSLNKVPGLLVNAGVDVLLVVWLLLFAVIFGWWYYQYVNWSNDIFQVTPDQILDINKTPLGQVTSDIASLDNILHLEYERRGLLQILFNYGNVYITIGGGKDMTFEDVYNPSAVQDDIERRRLERITKKEQDAVKAERERMADWFAAYHRNIEDSGMVDEPDGTEVK